MIVPSDLVEDVRYAHRHPPIEPRTGMVLSVNPNGNTALVMWAGENGRYEEDVPLSWLKMVETL